MITVNDRWGKETRGHHGGFYTTEYDLVDNDNAKDKKITHPWEECRGIGGSFGLNRNESLAEYSTSQELISTLIEKVAKGGNLLLDIGPAADGTIPVIMQQRLTDMGSWLKVNGEAIYDTQAWDEAPSVKNGGIYFTRKGNDLYVLCLAYPNTPIEINKVNQPADISLLGVDTKVSVKYSGNILIIHAPLNGQMSGKYAWVFRLKAAL